MRRYLPVALTLIFATAAVAFAQSKDTNKATATPPRDKTAQELEAERLLNERRDHAQSLLINLASDAGRFKDDRVRARSLARIADMLWENDRDRSRSLFRSAWDAAEIADAKSRERILEDLRKQQAGNPRGGYSYVEPVNLRREVLNLAARRESALGEEFLNKLAETKAVETAKETTTPHRLNSNEATKQRLDLAREIVSDGDLERGMQFAAPALNSVDMQSIEFLTGLRAKNPAIADRSYAAMMTRASANPQSDANTVSLLATYIFTPHVQVVFLPNLSSGRGSRPGPPANVSADLRAAYFGTAREILSRPLGDYQPGNATDAQYLAIKRMIPLFEGHAPAEALAAFRAQFEKLNAAASDQARNRNDQFMRMPTAPARPADSDVQAQDTREAAESGSAAREQSLVERRDRARTAAERDQVNVDLAVLMADKDAQRARDYIDKIDDLEVRNKTRAFVDASIAWELISKPDVDRALELARTGELTSFQKAWLLTGTALRMGQRDREKLLNLIELAATEAGRIQTSDPDRPRAFMALANVVFNFNRPNVWVVMDDAIKAANSADSFTGEDGVIAFRLDTKGNTSSHNHGYSDFDVAGIFTKLANENYEKAVEVARGLQNETPRANAVMAIARSVLKEKKK